MQLINIGFGNIVAANRIVSIVSPESAPIKRLVQEAKENKLAIDATYGRRTRSVLIMDSGYVILSAIQPETIAGRVNNNGITIEDDSKKEE
jgi:regulator of extracellular matrix RemA (YlzA/DUF370 family)